MAEKFNSDESLSPKELAKHLRQPSGEKGKEVGVKMNKGNKHICLNTYKVLDPRDNHHILEIGMGNGLFVSELLSSAKNLSYVGVDFSETMIQEASVLNKKLVDKGQVRFLHASIERLPFDDHSFDSITTTNTLYFWPQPLENCKELLRVLKPSGKLVVGYRSKSFLDELELAKYGFEKYEIQDAELLLKNGGFREISTQIIREPDLEFDGKVFQMEGMYTTALK